MAAVGMYPFDSGECRGIRCDGGVKVFMIILGEIALKFVSVNRKLMSESLRFKINRLANKCQRP